MKTVKSPLLAVTAFVLFGTGLLIGMYASPSATNIDALQRRLTLLESMPNQGSETTEIGSLIQRLDDLESKISTMHPAPLAAQGDISGYLSTLEERQSKLEDYVYTAAGQAVEPIQDDFSGKSPVNPMSDNNQQLPASKQELQAGIQLLEQAALRGVLDKGSFKKLDKIVGTMDKESNKLLWERMFADIQAGKYQFPEEESSSDYYELPNGEVSGE